MTKVTHTITDFQKVGITDELRGASGFGMVAGFDTTRAERLQPTFDFSASTHATVNPITDAKIDTFEQAGGSMYALGVSGNSPALHEWDEDNNRWTSHVTFSDTGTAADILTAYKDYFYGAMKGTHFWRGEIDGFPVPAHWQAQIYTTVADFIHHTADDILYFLYDNVVGKWDNSTYAAAALTLPTNLVITSGTQADDYLLVAGYRSDTNDSIVYWWNRDSSLSTITAKNIIDTGRVKLVMRTGGAPIAIILVDGSGVVQSPKKQELRVYSLSLNGAKLVNRIEATSITIGQKWEYDNRAYFGLTFTKDGTTYRGITEVDELGRLTLEYDVADATTSVQGVARSGGQVWASTADDKIFNTTTAYADSKIVETRFYRAKDFTKHVDFVGSTIMTEPLPSGAVVTLKYRESVDDSFTTLATFSEEGSVENSVIKQGCSTQPSITPEMQFRIESTSNAVVNGIHITLDEVKKASYDA